MSTKINSILKQVLENVRPPKKEMQEIEKIIEKFIEDIGNKLKSLNIDAEIFIGGSFAKETVIKKDSYDVDVFLRFNKKYKDNEISGLTKKTLDGMVNVYLIHGSRDYFKIKFKDDFFVELIPVIKVKNPKESLNITDLSYSHVNYVNKKTKASKLKEEIMLAKAFCYANHCYGAESYIQGFSGYALELLIISYGNFLKFVRAVSKSKEDKIIIDMEKHFKNKRQIMMDLNESKLHSPIVLIDPTHKHRNALAALSDETFEKFKKICKEFLEKPSLKFFEEKKTDLNEIKSDANKKKFEFILLEAITEKQEGDIAGSKLLKFYNHLVIEVEKLFEIKNKGFNYNGKQAARFYFVVKKKNEILIEGPNMSDKKNVEAFEKKHKTYYTKKGKVYAKEIVNFSLKKFLEKWKKKYKDKVKAMSIKEFEIMD